MKTSLVAFIGLSSVVSLGSAVAGAEAGASRAELQPTAKQHGLAVELVEESGRLVGLKSLACKAAPCDASSAALVAFPDDVSGQGITVEAIEIGPGRRVALVAAPVTGAGRFVTILWPSNKADEPVVNSLSGHFDMPKGGVEGEQKRSILLREPGVGGEKLFIGTAYDNVSICDRPAVISLKRLDPTTMTLTPVGARALSEEERNEAIAIDARAIAGEPRLDAPRVLSPRLASSAVSRSVKHSADRDLATRWAESKPGDGAGEFVVMNTAHQVPILAFEVVIRGGEAGASPKTFFIALPRAVYRVTLPPDASSQPPGTVFEIVLPEPVLTDCVTIVLDEGEDGEVGFAEIRARTRFDAMGPAELVAALEGPDREAVEALLLRGGPEATQAAMKGYRELEGDGRAAALAVIDAGPCELTTPFFASLLVGEGRGDDFNPALDRLAGHARDRLRGCRGPAVATLTAMMRDYEPGQRRVWAARELVDLDPAGSIDAILAVLTEGSKAPAEPGGDDEVRRGLRGALAIAARHRRAQEAVEAALAPQAFAARSLVERIDLLRAIGPGLADHDQAAAKALDQVLASDQSFRTRYLLLVPAAVLARKGEAGALELLKKSLADREPALRARAAEASAGIAPLAGLLAKTLSDPNPRVRAAALESLAETPGTADVAPRAIALLRDDPWTFVRSGAATALGAMPRSEATDDALVTAIDDASHLVRRAALRAIGRRHQIEAGARVHEVADDARLPIDTRAAAIATLGLLCRQESADLLTKLALRAGFQQLPYDQPLGMAALDALGDLHPPDLRQRIAPLLVPNARIPTPIRRIAQSVLKRPGRCGGSPRAALASRER